MLEGRYFTRSSLLATIVKACGNKLQGLALDWEERPLYQIIELIEAVRDNNTTEDDEEWFYP